MTAVDFMLLRMQAGLSRERLAEAAGVSWRTIYRYEHGQCSMSVDKWLKCLDTMGYEILARPKH